MEDFPLLILFSTICFVASSCGRKRNKKRQSGRARQSAMGTGAQGEQVDVRTRVQDRQAAEGFHAAFGEDAQAHTQPCDDMRIHLHDVKQAQMSFAAEGEDPCHAGGIQPQVEEPGNEADPCIAQDVLRGVIMSEILTRPQERRALQRSRQRTNGY